MEINFTDYLSQGQIEEICNDELRNQIRSYFRDENNANAHLGDLIFVVCLLL